MRILKKKLFKESKIPFSWRRIWAVVITIIVICVGVFVGLAAYTKSYTNRVLPGVHLGNIPIGGMNTEEIKFFLQDMNDKLINEGLRFEFKTPLGKNKSILLSPIIVTEGNSIELVHMDIEAEVERLMNYNRTGDFVADTFLTLKNRLKKPKIAIKNVEVDQDKILSELNERLSDFESVTKNASVEILSISPLEYKITTSSAGITYDVNSVIQDIVESWGSLMAPNSFIEQSHVKPEVVEADVENIVSKLENIFEHGDLEITYSNPHTNYDKNWYVPVSKIKQWLNVQKVEDDKVVFGFDRESVLEYLEEKVAPQVEVKSKNARFKMMEEEDVKVQEFQGSRPGISINYDETFSSINSAILQRTWHEEGVVSNVQLTIDQVEPDIKTGEINDLGIKEILSIGISDFSGSPANRQKNIRNAIEKLNGLLIEPGEVFSTLAHLRPFTHEGGYVEELVIKGDELKPEIGGGLCQIGTTLFRVAMNAGMEIVERRNHSLVVDYYNDAINGLPGTDATIYDPAPDFKFKNDTDNYILLQAEMNTHSMKLVFTIWGTNDGRRGYYTRPVVSKWIPHGPTRNIESTSLEVGEKKCQHAFRGANAHFTYIRELPHKDEEERTIFESHYRPIPEICLIGVEDPDKCDGEVCDESGTGEKTTENIIDTDDNMSDNEINKNNEWW